MATFFKLLKIFLNISPRYRPDDTVEMFGGFVLNRKSPQDGRYRGIIFILSQTDQYGFRTHSVEILNA